MRRASCRGARRPRRWRRSAARRRRPAEAARLARAALAAPRRPRAVEAIFLADPKVAAWLRHYPPKPADDATFAKRRLVDGEGLVGHGRRDRDREGRRRDGAVTEAWTGPQVAWTMARGSDGAFGGAKINSYPVWLGFCALFLLGLVDWRRPLEPAEPRPARAALVLASRSGSSTTATCSRACRSSTRRSLYLLGRCVWIGWRGRPPRGDVPVWPVWLLAAATVFLAGFRIGLNVRASNVIDVGYSGVIGAERIARGQSPVRQLPGRGRPARRAGRPTRTARSATASRRTAAASRRTRRATRTGRSRTRRTCPATCAFGWTGKWDDLPAAHFDLDRVRHALPARPRAGRLRFGGTRLAATLAFAWVAYPFTQYVSSSNTNDAIPPAFLVWGFWLVELAGRARRVRRRSPAGRSSRRCCSPRSGLVPGGAAAAADARLRRRRSSVATVAAFSILLLEPTRSTPRTSSGTARSSGRSTATRRSRSGTGGSTTRASPTCTSLQRVLEGLLLVGAVAVSFVPRRRSPLQLAALTAALLIGFEIVLTHWFYLYIPWFFPFVAFAAARARRRAASSARAETPRRATPSWSRVELSPAAPRRSGRALRSSR